MDASKAPLTSINLPEDILIEIQSRLPVKSLIRFASVCKYWFSLIKSPQFALKHLSTRNNSLQQINYDYFVAFPYLQLPIARFISYQTLDFSSIIECKPIKANDTCNSIRWKLFGPCNGIFCIIVFNLVDFPSGFSAFLLWNPATREVFMPNQPVQILRYVGFGFDEKSNDYKIVMFGYNGNVELYSLRRNCWRTINYPFGDDDWFGYDVPTSNRRMYTWMIHEYDELSIGCSLVSFDMNDEVFVKTPVPEDVISKDHSFFRFLPQWCNREVPVLLRYSYSDGCLSSVDIWVLNEYGSNGFWTKEKSFSRPEEVIMGPLRGSWEIEGILFDLELDIWTCAYEASFREMTSYQVPGTIVVGYTESLVSIKDLCQRGELEDCLITEALQSPREYKDSREDKVQDIRDLPCRICCEVMVKKTSSFELHYVLEVE